MVVIAKDANLQIHRFETFPFGTNAYVIVCGNTQESVLVDAPGEASSIAEQMSKTTPRYILITHSHMDHTSALVELESKLNIPVAAHPADASRLPTSVEWLLKDEDIVSFGNIELRVLHTPGHTPGSICFLKGKYLISGDTLFPNGPGKTDTPADFNQIIESLRGKIFTLPDETLVFPGHGEATVLKREKDAFAAFSSRIQPSNLCGDVLWTSD